MTDFDRLAAALADRYRIDRELGSGGMATVYLAHDLKHDRRVAVKVLRPELAAVLGPARFLREITTTANLRHPHILPLYDSGEANGVLYYVMPFVEGESLRDRLTRERQLPIGDSVRITREVADALGYAHSRGIVHRDIKPENILLESGHAVVTDFGIARAVSEAGGGALTETGVVIGTPVYMSPEQGAADAQLDGRTDIYALGCALYEMLAGHPPFSGATAHEILVRHTMDPVPPISSARRTVPAPLEHALVRALAKVPADRFATAAEFAEALERAHGTRNGPAQVRRRPPAWVLVTLAVAVAGGLAAWRLLHARGAAPVGAADRSIAVLYFDNQSPDTTDAYLADGLTEEIALRLSRVPRLAVKSRYAVRRFRGSAVTEPVALGRALGVTMLIDGGVQHVAHRVRVTVELVNAATGDRIWAGEYDRSDTDLLGLETEVARSIATEVAGRLEPGERQRLAERPTEDPAAYDHFLRGNFLLARRTPAATAAAIQEYEGALRLDSAFTRARARIAFGYALFVAWEWSYPGLSADSLLARGVRADSIALARDTTSSDAWLAAGILSWFLHPVTWKGAVEAHERAVALDPTNAEAQNLLGITLMNLGRDSAAAVALHRALALDPYRPITLQRLAELEWVDGHTDRALRDLDSALTLAPAFLSAYGDRAEIRLQMNDVAAAGTDVEIMARLETSGAPVPRSLGIRAAVEGRSGDTVAARRTVDTLVARIGTTDSLLPNQASALALALLWTGSPSRALDALERANPQGPLLWSLLRYPVFDQIRRDPRFQRVVAGSRAAEFVRH